ncbi:hypothetical protein [Borrelia sp. A-FGy1]|uniref:hypothetical protein n=1 Tax=Borrelia sp. A-FGy1 TaxID=2608247 RepID=UPI001E548CCA|nr:hypothetical protein [Borrelia sp. A-FGy1]
MKGFLAIKLSNKEYFSVLNLEDISVKKVVLGKILDETSVKLDFYISKVEDFSNPVFVGSFFLDNLRKESSDINVYFRMESVILYVYGECDGIENKSKFDLSLYNLDVKLVELNDFSKDSQVKNEYIPDSSNLDFEDVTTTKSLKNDFKQDKDNYSLDNLDNIDDLNHAEDLYSLNEKEFINEGNLDISGLLDKGDDTFSALDFESKPNLGDFDNSLKATSALGNDSNQMKSEPFNFVNNRDNIEENSSDLYNSPSECSDISFDSDNNVIKFIEDEDIDFSSVNIASFKDSYSDDLSVDDIIADIDKGLKEGPVDDVFLDVRDSSKGLSISVENEQLGSDTKEGFMQTFMLYLSLISLFLLIFFSLFLIFSKVLNPRNFKISYHYICEKEKVKKHERSSYV